MLEVAGVVLSGVADLQFHSKEACSQVSDQLFFGLAICAKGIAAGDATTVQPALVTGGVNDLMSPGGVETTS